MARAKTRLLSGPLERFVLPLLTAGLAWAGFAPGTLAADVSMGGEDIEASALESPLPQPDSLVEEDPTLSQTSVEQLSDVAPTDWAYQALRNLVEQYGCLEGYPDGTFRGDRPLTRFEFTAGLNACLNAIATLTATDPVTEEDLQALRRLQEEFAPELELLAAQITDLEAQTAELQASAFSTTTQLRGEMILSLEQLAGGDQANGSGNPLPQSLAFGSRARLKLRHQLHRAGSAADTAGCSESRHAECAGNRHQHDPASL